MIDIDNDGNTSDVSISSMDRECLDVSSNFKTDSDDTSMSDTDDSIESRDEEGFLKDPMRNEIRHGHLRTRSMYPICSKLDILFHTNILDRKSIFYTLLKNAEEYVEWLIIRKDNKGVQFE